MYQFFVDDSQIGKEFVTITGSDVNHIKNVLRMKAGEEIRVSNNAGKDLLCSISEVTDQFVQADILDQAEETELKNKIYLFQALPKGDRMETVIQKAVELGVHEIIPVAMKYCVVKLDEKKAASKVKRYQAIAESAAKQSKRSIVPQIHPVMTYKEAVKYGKEISDCQLVPYENQRGMAATKEALDEIRIGDAISVYIGPEGGFAPEEIELVQSDMKIVSLGKRILRTDTAAITTISMLMLHLEMKMAEEISGKSEKE